MHPANAEAFSLFTSCRPEYETITSTSGCARLYNGISRAELAAVMDMQGVKRKRRRQLLHDVQLLERGALEGERERQR